MAVTPAEIKKNFSQEHFERRIKEFEEAIDKHLLDPDWCIENKRESVENKKYSFTIHLTSKLTSQEFGHIQEIYVNAGWERVILDTGESGCNIVFIMKI